MANQPTNPTNENDLFLKFEPVENDYPLIIEQGGFVIAKIPPNLPLQISSLASFYAKDVSDIIYRVIECESHWNQNAKGSAGEIGIAQFKPATWKLFNEMRGTNLNIYSAEDQWDMISWAFRFGYQSHWTCYNLVK